MMKPFHSSILSLIITLLSCTSLHAESWPQFRGPNASGIAVGDQNFLQKSAPDSKHLLWKTPIAKGHSSPVISGDRIFLTSLRGKQLLTMGLDASNGKILWEAIAPYEKLERVHKIGSPATASVTTDGERVYSFFGSTGLFCYDIDGKLLWHEPLGPFNNQFGATGSPILVDDRIVMIQDHDTGSHLVNVR